MSSKRLKGLGTVNTDTSFNDTSADFIRDKMLELVQIPDEKTEILKEWTEDSKDNYSGLREFAKKVSSHWYRNSFCKDGFCGTTDDISKLREDFKDWTFFFQLQYEKYEAALLYSFWLFFSGMAVVYPNETINFAKKMKDRFSGEQETITSLIFFRFLKSYAQAKGIHLETKNGEGNYYEKIDEINDCINESKENKRQNIILAAVADKLELIDNCIQTHLTRNRTKEMISLTFPELENSTDGQLQKNALSSILHAGVAKFYLNQRMEEECKQKIEHALKLYADNTLAMIQHEKFLKAQPDDSNTPKNKVDTENTNNFKKKINLTVKKLKEVAKTDERKKYVQTIDSFKKIVKLIEKKDEYKEIGISQEKGHDKGQFIKLPLIQVRIKFDANLELAHLYSKLGDYENARKCYVKLEEELKRKSSDLTPNGYSQLESILLLNMGRNELDGQDYDRAIEHFQKILTKGDDVSKDVSSIAHMNLGLAYYYLEDNFDKAKEELVKAIKSDPTNSHSYYNLGVLYYMEERSVEKAKTFINKSLYTNIENNEIIESKDYDKFKESLDRLSEAKDPKLGTGWWQWWFGQSKIKDRGEKKNILNKLVYLLTKYGRKIAGILLLVFISALVIKLNYDLYLHDYLNLIFYHTYTIHSHVLSNADFILLGVNIAILLLPVISRLKIADVEIEMPVESRGNEIYQLMPLPNSIMRTVRSVARLNLNFGLFIIDLWY